MKTLLPLLVTSLLALPLAAAGADAKAELQAAAKKLADQPNYSWTSTPKTEGGGGGGGNFRPGPTEGQTEKGGWTHTKSTMGDNTVESVFKGDKGAIKREDTWQTAGDLEGDDRGAFIARRLRAFKAPAAEAADIADKVKELKKGEGGLYSGELTDEGARALFTRGGRRGGQGGGDAKGSVKFWVKDGLLSKYEYQLQGTFTRGDSGEEVKVSRTTTVEIRDVGKTKVSVPEEAKKKLS